MSGSPIGFGRFAIIVAAAAGVAAGGCAAAKGPSNGLEGRSAAAPLPSTVAGDAGWDGAQATPRERVEAVVRERDRRPDAPEAIRAIPGGSAELAAIAADDASPLANAAVELLGDVQSPEGLAALSSVVDREARDDDPEPKAARWRSAVAALSRYDTVQTAFLLTRVRSELSARQQGRRGPEAAKAIEAIDDYLWRMGLTGELGMCSGAGSLKAGPARGPLGTAHPALAVAADPERRWIVLRQDRKPAVAGNGSGGEHAAGADAGEESAPAERLGRLYWVLGSGAGEPIDELVAHDPRGRFVVVRHGLCLTLLSVVARREVDLGGADARALEGRPNRGVAFSADGLRMLYLRPNGGVPRVVVRELATGAEATVDPGAGTVVRAWFDPTGEQVLTAVAPAGAASSTAAPSPGADAGTSGAALRTPVASVRGGNAVEAPNQEPPEPPAPPSLPPAAVVGAGGEDAWAAVARGPLRWK